MVDAITAVAASAPSTPTRVESSLSIASEPDNKWVAERQAQIDADLEALSGSRAARQQAEDLPADEDLPPLFEGHARRSRTEHGLNSDESEEHEESQLLSGESDRIGSTNFDEETPFGKRVAIV